MVADLSNLRVAVLAIDGFEEVELTEPVHIRNADGNWVEREVVVDGNWVKSRQPDDIPAFNREMMNLFTFTPTASGSH